jgi:hypothetical protein
MANSRDAGAFHEYATVDTAPAAGTGGYFTNEVNPRQQKMKRLFFSIRDTVDDSSASVVTVKLQFRCNNDAGWTDFVALDGSAFAIGNRVQIDDFGPGVHWRAGVLDNTDYTSGSVTFGFDW